MRWRLGAFAIAGLATVALALSGSAAAAPSKPRLESRAWALIDARSGDVIASHAAARRLPIASATKMMTAWVAMKELPLGRKVRAAPYEAGFGESLLELRPNQRISVHDLLAGLIMRSGNDAAHALAIAAAGSTKRFVRQMNLRAAALGLSDTHYANPIGLDQKGNYSSARDLTSLAQRLLRLPAFAKIADARTMKLRSLRPQRRISTINELLYIAPWATGVKTGHTWGARYVLVGSGRRDGVDLISAVVGAPSEEARYSESVDLLEYGFSRYRKRLPVRVGQVLAEPSIRYAGGALPLRAGRSVAIGVRKGQRMAVAVRAPEEVQGPLRRGAVLGQAIVSIDGRRVAAVPLLASRGLPEANLLDRAGYVVSSYPLPIAVALFVILMGTAALYRRMSRRNQRDRDVIE